MTPTQISIEAERLARMQRISIAAQNIRPKNNIVVRPYRKPVAVAALPKSETTIRMESLLRHPRAARAILAVAEKYRLAAMLLVGECRDHEVVAARDEIYVRLHDAGFSYRKIGLLFGKTHKIVSRGVRRLRPPERSKWTRQRVADLLRMWANGATSSEIAAHLGDEFTRSAVMGKVGRLGLQRSAAALSEAA